ncbi:MAG: 23S rRNA (pseudouridine(1915)-N(3))-methyltransferase RlmH [Lachnospiraceae bacterium]|nr:23S rRNA (pseudouridine(1915)-N(3))-methyltransferase RlmH [Lachnospiraceae bacterium]
MKITLITVGKIREPGFVQAIAEYQKRLSAYCSLKIIEVTDEKTPDTASAADEDLIRRKEGDRILRHVVKDPSSYVISLEINGRQFSSEEFSAHLEKQAVAGKSHFCFIIGGSLGLSPSVTGLADLHLSFSKMTFPHQLMRVILLEQIYRSFKIQRHEPYHK